MRNLYNFVKKKIISSKIETYPYPFFLVKNLLPQKEVINLKKALPSFDQIGKDVLFQSISKTKKTILPSSSEYKKLYKRKPVKQFDKLFRFLKPIVLKKFSPYIKEYVSKEYQNSKIIYHSSFSIMKKGYKKSVHIDRRDHLIHAIFYASSNKEKGGEIQIDKLKKHTKIYDVFPKRGQTKIVNKFKTSDNFCLFIFNTPWSYHSAKKYIGKKDRKYFYIAYDFPITNSGAIANNRKKGFNMNNFWKKDVKVKSEERKTKFLSE